MKFIVDDEKTGTLSVRRGSQADQEVIKGLNLDTIYKWYPMNIGYMYRYDIKGDRLYLYPADSPMPRADYDYPVRERYKPIGVLIKDINPEMVCYNVMEDNVELCVIADALELPHMLQANYSYHEVKKGLVDLLDAYEEVRTMLYDRLVEDGLDVKKYRNQPVSVQDEQLHRKATSDEKKQLKTFGKLYTMLNLMQKIAKIRQ